MEKDFCDKYQLWKLFRRIRNQTAAHAQKGVKCPLREQVGEIFPNSYITCFWEWSSKYVSLKISVGQMKEKTYFSTIAF